MTAVNNFIQNYLSNLYIPRITWTDIIEIFIIAFVLYSFLVWISGGVLQPQGRAQNAGTALPPQNKSDAGGIHEPHPAKIDN